MRFSSKKRFTIWQKFWLNKESSCIILKHPDNSYKKIRASFFIMLFRYRDIDMLIIDFSQFNRSVETWSCCLQWDLMYCKILYKSLIYEHLMKIGRLDHLNNSRIIWNKEWTEFWYFWNSVNKSLMTLNIFG